MEAINESEPVSTTSSVASYGACLATARESLGLTQADVASQLHLSREIINDIEHETFHASIAIVYCRGYVRSYARLLALDEEVLLQAFDACHPVEQPVSGSFFETTFFSKDNGQLWRRLLKKPSSIFFLITVVLFIFIFLGWVFDHGHTVPKVSSTASLPITRGHASLSLPTQKQSLTLPVDHAVEQDVKLQAVVSQSKSSPSQSSPVKHDVVASSHQRSLTPSLQPSYTVTPVH